MSTQRYQGYPYVNPRVTDAPSLDPVTAARWTNLPRRPINTAVAGSSGSGSTPTGSGSGGSTPAGSGSNAWSGAGGSRDPPTSSASVSVTIPPKKDDIDQNPVVYIELPEENGSDVCQSLETEETTHQYVQDTILYDPFEDRRIIPKEEEHSEASTPDSHSAPSSSTAAARPNILDLMRPGPSSSQLSSSNATPGLPSFLEKESLVYGGHGSDGFPLSPIPISEFPEPPPAYTELAMTPIQTPSPQSPDSQASEQPSPSRPPPPRTEVIVPNPHPMSPVGLMNFNRKYLACHHCGARVHTLVIRENGHVTYIIACLLFLFIMPFFIIVYFTDWFKHKNHYCPNCNKLIGYELPLFGETVHYVP